MRLGALGALTLGLAHCGGPTVHQAAPCPTVETDVLPDRWLQLAAVARSASCSTERRIHAIRQMALAGPQANIVLPTLAALAESAAAPEIKREAEAARRALLPRPTTRGTTHEQG